MASPPEWGKARPAVATSFMITRRARLRARSHGGMVAGRLAMRQRRGLGASVGGSEQARWRLEQRAAHLVEVIHLDEDTAEDAAEEGERLLLEDLIAPSDRQLHSDAERLRRYWEAWGSSASQRCPAPAQPQQRRWIDRDGEDGGGAAQRGAAHRGGAARRRSAAAAAGSRRTGGHALDGQPRLMSCAAHTLHETGEI